MHTRMIIKEKINHLRELVADSMIYPDKNNDKILRAVEEISYLADQDDVSPKAKRVMNQMEAEAIKSLDDENAWAGSEILDEDKYCCTILLSYGVGERMFTKLYILDKETLETFEP